MKTNVCRTPLKALVGTLALAFFTVPVTASAITLKEAAQEAVLKNPEVLSRWHAFKAATENVGVVKGSYLPDVDLTAGVAAERQDTPTIDDEYTRSGLSLVLNQMLFDGFATRNEVAKYSYAQRVRYNELLDASESTALEAMRAYTDVLRYRKLHQLAQENYAQHRAVFDQIQQRVQSGVGRRVDLEQASGRLALSESNLLTEASNLHDVSARYQRIVGSLPPESMDDLPVLINGIPGGSDQALRSAYVQHPALQAAQENIVAAQSDAKVRHAKFLPRVDLRARQDLGRNLDGVDGSHDLTNLELLLNYNLFNGGSDKAAERQYWEQVNVARDLRDKTCRDVRQTLYIAYNDVNRLREQLVYLEQHQNAIEKARDAYRKQFDIGQRTLLDLLDSENELFEAKRAYARANFDYMFAMGRTHAGMGQLLPTLGLQRLPTDELINADEKAAFDPDSVCPPDAPMQASLGANKLVAAPVPAEPRTVIAVADEDRDGVLDEKDQCLGTPAGVRVDHTGCELKDVINLKGVNFEYASSKLRKDSKAVLDEAAAMLKRYPDLRVEVAGHTDSNNRSKNPSLNKDLSQNRAKVVMDYLVAAGIAPTRLVAQGYGETQPIADNATAAGQAMNRRTELRLRK
jgi:adhesin transport system outer membrane protein